MYKMDTEEMVRRYAELPLVPMGRLKIGAVIPFNCDIATGIVHYFPYSRLRELNSDYKSDNNLGAYPMAIVCDGVTYRTEERQWDDLSRLFMIAMRYRGVINETVMIDRGEWIEALIRKIEKDK